MEGLVRVYCDRPQTAVHCIISGGVRITALAAQHLSSAPQVHVYINENVSLLTGNVT